MLHLLITAVCCWMLPQDVRKLLMSLPLHAKTYVVFFVFCFKVCYLYSCDQNMGLKGLEVLGTSGAGGGEVSKGEGEGELQWRRMKKLEDTVVDTAGKTGNNTWNRSLFGVLVGSEEHANQWTSPMKSAMTWKAVKKDENNRKKRCWKSEISSSLRNCYSWLQKCSEIIFLV